MRVRDIMSSRPIVVGERFGDVKRLMELGHVHHVPVVEGGRLVGVWISTEGGPIVMLGPERVHETGPSVDATEALEALIGGAEAVLVWDSGVPAGVLTRSDLTSVVRTAVDRGIGRRHPRPTVIRIAGPAGSGKTTLLMRTLALLGRIDVAIIQGNAEAPGEVAPLGGARALDEPEAHRRSGLQRAVDKLADAQLILVEDRDGPHDSMGDVGEDVRVAVMPAADLANVTAERLEGVEALLATRADEASEMATEDALQALRKSREGLHTFAVAAGHDDRGLDAWSRWLESQAFRRRG
jgi:CBS domain-containing protein